MLTFINVIYYPSPEINCHLFLIYNFRQTPTTSTAYARFGSDDKHQSRMGSHCRGLIYKCNRTMGMIKRAVGFNAPVNVTTSLYLTLVRSNLEYCSSVWSPSTVSDIKAIKSMQRPALCILVIFLIILKLNTTNDAPCFICIHHLTDVKMQICYMFLNILQFNMTYPNIII